MKVNVDLPKNGYEIVIENGAIQKVGTWLSQFMGTSKSSSHNRTTMWDPFMQVR